MPARRRRRAGRRAGRAPTPGPAPVRGRGELDAAREREAAERVWHERVGVLQERLARLVRKKALIEHADDELSCFILRYELVRPTVARRPSEFEACPLVSLLPWVEAARAQPLRDVFGFRCSEPVAAGLPTAGNVQSAALSSFGVLAMFVSRCLHLHDLVDGAHVAVGVFAYDTIVAWHRADVVALTEGESLVRRAPYLALKQRPAMGAFTTEEIPKCRWWPDLQLAQYTGKLVYGGNDGLVSLDLGTMRVQVADGEPVWVVGTCCVLPAGTAALGTARNTLFWVDEGRRRAGQTRAAVGPEVLLSEAEPADLARALVRGSFIWYVPGGDRPVGFDDFHVQTGWEGHHFMRLVGDVFLFRDPWSGWKIIRIHVA